MTPTLESAITQAVETHQAELPGSEAPVEQVPAVESTKEEVEVTEKPELDQDAEQGRLLVQAFRDPSKAGILIDYIARTNGYTKGAIETPKDVKEAKADITKILEEELGEELKFIAPKLGKALDRYLENVRSSNMSPELENLRGRVENQERQQIEQEVGKVHTAIANEYFGSDDMPIEVAQALSRAMDEFPPPENSTPATYYRKIFNFVAGERGLTKQTVKQGERVIKNLKDTPARQLAATNRGVTPSVEGNARKMSLGDAVNKAVAEINEKSGKA